MTIAYFKGLSIILDRSGNGSAGLFVRLPNLPASLSRYKPDTPYFMIIDNFRFVNNLLLLDAYLQVMFIVSMST